MELRADDVAVVTGGASGIGLALARRLGKEGLKVVIADVQQDALDAAKASLEADGGEVLAVRTDVSDWNSVEALRDAVVDRFGTAHLVCNNAGVGSAGDPWHDGLKGWEWTIGVNLMGAIHGVTAFLPLLESQRRGHIVNTASMAALTVGVNGPYGATKHAVAALTESLWFAMRTADGGVDVSALCPGWVNTSIRAANRNWPERLGPKPEVPQTAAADNAALSAAISRGRDPAEVAEITVEGINANRFWILTDPELIEGVHERARSIEHGIDPVNFPRF